jgi:diguanylate cyclase (GGDEF)-like protein
VLGVIATVSAFALVSAALIAWRRPVAPRWGHPLTVVLVLLVTAASVGHLVQTGERGDSAAAMLALVALGAALLDRRWLLPALALVWVGWALGVSRVGGDAASWRDWMAALVAATAMGVAINVGRRSAMDHAAEALSIAERAVTEDQLTGLLNPRGLALLGREIVGVAQRGGEAAHSTFLDIDGLTAVNDALGREEGDNLILSVAEALQACVRGTDVVARWTGDQFVVVGLGAGTPLVDLEGRIRSYLATSFPGDVAVAGLRLSMGRSVLAPWDVGDLATMVEAAQRDMAVSRAARGHHPIVELRPDGAETSFDS